jgi:hypothetical protein
MPNDVKGILSAIVLIVAAVLAFWSGSPVRHDFSIFIMVIAGPDDRGDVGVPGSRREKWRREAGQIIQDVAVVALKAAWRPPLGVGIVG